MRRKLAVIFLVAAALTHATISVAADERLTPDESREANAVARLFVKRMTETNDVAVVIDELFVPDFIDRLLDGQEDVPFIFIKRSLARRLTRDELRRYYVANINFWHSHSLYVFGSFSSERLNETGNLYPPAIARLIGLVDADSEKIERAGDGSPAEVADAVARLRANLDAMEQATALLRAEVEGRKLAQSALYKKAVSEMNESFDLYKPWPSVCDDGCYGLPAGSRLIIVNVPSFQLQIALAAGGAKIITALPYVD